MAKLYVSPQLLEESLRVLASWSTKVHTQRARHVWSLLPLKAKGAMPGQALTYAEVNDREFMDRFLAVRQGDDYPYFDPFSRQWLPKGYYHSNMATMRKNRFARQWGACEWEDDVLRLSSNYSDIFVEKALTKAGSTTPIPAIACAVWFFKRPGAEWAGDQDFVDGVPATGAEAVQLFRKKFGFANDAGWSAIFDTDESLLSTYATLLRVTP